LPRIVSFPGAGIIHDDQHTGISRRRYHPTCVLRNILHGCIADTLPPKRELYGRLMRNRGGQPPVIAHDGLQNVKTMFASSCPWLRCPGGLQFRSFR
jgi:hypothetical protein